MMVGKDEIFAVQITYAYPNACLKLSVCLKHGILPQKCMKTVPI